MKTKRILSLALALITAILVLVSCAGTNNVASNGTAFVVVETSAEGSDKYIVYEVELSKLEERSEGALSLLEYISAQKNSTLYYSATWGGGYGAYINSIAPLYPDSFSNQYIAVYTTEECDFAVPNEYSPTVSTVKYGDMTLTYSGVGISTMTVKDGTVILFRMESY